ncbi:unnamed protein product [Rotaria sordida]|uniref:Uncharacterized protein n=1 Tax=Rotaria sordida TaxID=392033 RepID=A0A819VL27_9BILA|nr:unnamed protein product [Rotaria sordida]
MNFSSARNITPLIRTFIKQAKSEEESKHCTDDQEIFVINLSVQGNEIFRPHSKLLFRIGNTGSQVGAVNFAFVVFESTEMAKAITVEHDNLLKME